MSITLFREPLCKSYHNGVCSTAFFFRALCIILMWVLPFVAAYISRSFWFKEGVYREQPMVVFKNQAFIMLEGNNPDDHFFWSTSPKLNQLIGPKLRIPLIKSSQIDTNNDGIYDLINITATFPLESGEKIYHAKSFFMFDYSIRERVQLRMEGMAYMDYVSSNPGTSLWSMGQLNLKANFPLSTHYPMLLTDTFLDENSFTHLEDISFPTLMQNYQTRNISTEFISYPQWTAGVSNTFQLKIIVQIPSNQQIVYLPTIPEVLKFAWIQYLAAFIFIYSLLHYFQTWVFRYQILPSSVVLDGPRLHPTKQNKNY
eukprot:TRINITY_DN2062_c0_g1_i9.p1 TRINITY_DN2062_c0_g1~~TRINITY_DN2062_c0_g1_i9.p1  ORF type:complete len:314 (-),score=40.29 TRINITY_DN2062_c0_g1_i9:266-1207(-)